MWEQIRSNRRRSILLISGMAVMLVLVGWLGGESLAGAGRGLFGVFLGLIIWAGLLVAYFGGAERLLLFGAGAGELQREDSPRLFNIVEEMKIAAGLPFMPRIYLVDEMAPNAFAFGRTPQKSGIAVTRGLMYRLNRDELQGVIAHEMAHLRNRDVQFMTLAAVMLGAVVLLSDIVRRGTWLGGRSRSRAFARSAARPNPYLVAAGLIFAILGPLMAQILYFACSRRREYLADACAVQFTRYSEGLASALAKISQAGAGLSFASKVTAPMFIVNPLSAAKRERTGLFATHPPTSERIRLLRSIGGASLTDYEAAYRQAVGGTLIGRVSLDTAKAQSMRPPSQEGPVETHRSVRKLAYRGAGYLAVSCDCGLESSVPTSYEPNEIRCIRCGRLLSLPSVSDRAETVARIGAQRRKSRREARLAGAGEGVLQYTRRSRCWESFRCRCGRTVQLSPSFMAPRVRCQKCGREIEVQSAPAPESDA